MRKSTFFFISLCFFFSCQSQVSNTNSEAGNPFFYEISGNGLDKPSYLFGTLHAIPKSQFSVPLDVENKLKSVDALVLEIDVDIPLKTQLDMAQKMLLPDNKTMQDYMLEEEYLLLRSLFIDSLGVSESKTDKYMHVKPIYLISVILQEYLKNIESYEVYFDKIAEKNDIDFFALETVEYQMSLLDTISIEAQLESYLEGNILQEYNKLLKLYFQGDLDKLQEYLMEYEGYSDIEAQLITSRNRAWLPVFEELIAKKSLFIAVGAGHLPGEEGVLNLLRQQGYQVQKIKNN